MSEKQSAPAQENRPIRSYFAKSVTDKTGTHTSASRNLVKDAIASVNEVGPYTGQDRDSE